MREPLVKNRNKGAVDNGLSSGTELGSVRVNSSVIVAIVKKAALAVPGVTRLAGSALVDSIAEMIGNRRMSDRAIGVRAEGDSVKIDLKVNMLYGACVPEVAAQIQAAVADEVEKITGTQVTEVNVIVEELEEDTRSEKEDNEDATANSKPLA